MAEIVPSFQVADAYNATAVIGPAPYAAAISWNVAVAPVYVQFWKPDPQLGPSAPVLDPTEYGPCPPNTIGNSAQDALGARFRNAIAGSVATIESAELDFSTDVQFSPGQPVNGVLLPNGQVIAANVAADPSSYVNGSDIGFGSSTGAPSTFTFSSTLLNASHTYVLTTFQVQGLLVNSSTTAIGTVTLSLLLGSTVLAQTVQVIPSSSTVAAGTAIPFEIDASNILPYLATGATLKMTASWTISSGSISVLGLVNGAWLAQAVLAS